MRVLIIPLLVLLAHSNARAANADLNKIVKTLGTGEVFTVTKALKYKDIHSYYRASPLVRTELCKHINQEWPGFATRLETNADKRTVHVIQTVHKFLAITVAVCPNPLRTMHARVQTLASHGLGFYFDSLAYPSNLMRLLPNEATGITKQTSAENIMVQPTALIKFFIPEALTGLDNSKCNSNTYSRLRLPLAPECTADWFFWRLTESGSSAINSDADAKPLAMQIAKAISARSHGPIAWSSILTVPFIQTGQSEGRPVFPTRYPALAGKMLSDLARKNPNLGAFVSANARSLQPLLTFAPATAPCSQIQNFVGKTLQTLPTKSGQTAVDPDFLAVLGHLLFACPASSKLAAVDKVIAQIPAALKVSASASDVPDISLVNTIEVNANDDLFLRDILGLRFNYGATYEELEFNAINKSTQAISGVDSILAHWIRISDREPWVQLPQNIEDLDLQRKMLGRTLEALGTSKLPHKRLLQTLYLEGHDPAPLLAVDSPATNELIRKVRELSVAARAAVPAMMPISNHIHNSLHPGLVPLVEAFYANLPPADKERSAQIFTELIAKLRSLFALDIAASERFEQHLRQSGIKFNDAFWIQVALVRSGKDGYRGSLLAIEQTLEAQLQAIEKSEEPAASQAYLPLVRALRETRILARPDSKSQTLTASTQERAIIFNAFEERVARLHWFIFSQSRRVSTNPEYSKSLIRRLGAFQISKTKSKIL